MADRKVGTVIAVQKPACVHVWRYAHVVKRGIARYRIYYCGRCLMERQKRV